MKIGLIVIDDGIYTHLWVRDFLEYRNHTICAGACLNPFFARNFNPQNSCAKAILNRTRYYGMHAALRFGLRFLSGKVVDALFRLSGSGRAASVRSLLAQAGIPLISIPGQDVNDPGFHESLKAHDPDVLVCTFSQKTGKRLRRLAPQGCLNIHFSCLPKNAGREPVFWSLLSGKGYGLTVYRPNAMLDAGRMLAQISLDPIGINSLDAAIKKVCMHIPDALSTALLRLEAGTIGLMPPTDLNSWPGPKDIQAFRKAGYRFI